MSTIPEDLSPEEMSSVVMQPKTADEKAREEAEARRQRIMKSSNIRMGIVEGTIPKPTKNYDNNDADTADVDGNNTNDETNTNVDNDTEVVYPVVTKKPITAAARMAAMRKMRFKKAEAAATDPSAANDAVATTTSATNAGLTEPTDVAVDPSKSTSSDDSATTSEVKTSATSLEKDENSSSHEQPMEGVIPASKKYEGVAKMRRRMIKEKQMQQHQGTNESNDADEPLALKKLKEKALKTFTMKHKRLSLTSIQMVPFYMSVFTLLLLLIAGLDVGLHQGQIDYGIQKELIKVHTELAPKTLDQRFQQGVQYYTNKYYYKTGKDGAIDTDNDLYNKNTNDEQDEFDDASNDSNRELLEANIDPLFGIDLDKLTAGTGLYFMIARFAVGCHRVNLAMFYYLPIRIYNTIINSIYQLISSPPLFCLMAITIRQIVGKLILGAHNVPKIKGSSESDNNATKKEGNDILTMIKNVAGSFITKSFPTAALLYDIWSHVRLDMYVILFGFLIGVAYTHTMPKSPVSIIKTKTGGTDEL